MPYSFIDLFLAIWWAPWPSFTLPSRTGKKGKRTELSEGYL